MTAVGAWAGAPPHVPTAPPVVVGIEAQPCDRPQRRVGAATFVADGLVVTAGHLVGGELRRLEVAGVPARVLAVDSVRDLALVGLESGTGPREGRSEEIEWREHVVAEAPLNDQVTIAGPTRREQATVVRSLRLRVSHQRDGTVNERDALELNLLVEPGQSGSGVVDTGGRLVGVVVLRRAGRGVSYASVLPPLDELARSGPLAPLPGCV